MHVFLATGLTEVGQSLEPSEQITVHVLTEEEVRERLRDGTIQDGKTMAGLYRYFDGHGG
ncbi:MAG: hypothetical protein GWO04_29505 [Actinobacteria bacterium]|nr:hypothetical protein [Actinomycetota bacterium]